MYILRKAIECDVQNDSQIEEAVSRDIAELRQLKSWVLLGEPGAGKSETFKQEHKRTAGWLGSVSEFLETELEELQEYAIVYLDALEEARNGGQDNVTLLGKVARKLRQLNNPSFRISCRAADWYGETDLDLLSSIDEHLKVFKLEALSIDDAQVRQYIQEQIDLHSSNISIDIFLHQIESQNFAELLGNPLSIKLLIESIAEGRLANSRSQIYAQASKNLALEYDPIHRLRRQGNNYSTDSILERAGYLFSLMLLSNRRGFKLHGHVSNNLYLSDHDIGEYDSLSWRAMQSTLFSPASTANAVEPFHRTMAEYLAAVWLTKRIEKDVLPLGRVLRLFEGTDKKTISSLRGLFAWLATLSPKAFAKMVTIDPLGIVLYGDAACLSSFQKMKIIEGLQQEANAYAGFQWRIPNSAVLSALWDSEFETYFVDKLSKPFKSAAEQAFAECLLKILNGHSLTDSLSQEIKSVIADKHNWPVVRYAALDTLLSDEIRHVKALELLDKISINEIQDVDDALLGILLEKLYPGSIPTELLLTYLHKAKNKRLVGSYLYFWEYQLPERVPVNELPILLNQLAERRDLPWPLTESLNLHRMISKLLLRALHELDEQIDDEQLYRWLGINTDEYHGIHRPPSHQQKIAAWFSQRPHRYKSFLGIAVGHAQKEEHPHNSYFAIRLQLVGASPPPSIGLWHLDQAHAAKNRLEAEIHLQETIRCLISKQGDESVSLEMIEQFAETYPEYQQFIRSQLVHERPLAALELAEKRKQSLDAAELRKQENTRIIRENLTAIREGSANLGVFYNLSIVWKGIASDIPGDTPEQRLNNFCNNATEAHQAATTGFQQFVLKTAIPDYLEVIDLYFNNKRPWNQFPLIVGLELLFKHSPDSFNLMNETRLKSLVATQLAYGLHESTNWLKKLAAEKAKLVSEVWLYYLSRSLNKGPTQTNEIYPFCHEVEYVQAARIAVPKALEKYPAKAHTEHLKILRNLLHFALNYIPDTLASLIPKKLSRKSIDAGQEVFWLTAGLILKPKEYQDRLIDVLGQSALRVNYFIQFIAYGHSSLSEVTGSSAKLLSNLIEVITPQADAHAIDREEFVTLASELWLILNNLVKQLGNSDDPATIDELERLQNLPSLEKIRPVLESTLYDTKIRIREKNFAFLEIDAIQKILNDLQPADAKDLQQLVLDHLDDYATIIHTDKSNIYSRFWNTHETLRPRNENDCRDVILRELDNRLSKQGVMCAPEAQYVNTKRADIQVFFGSEFSLPIEIKCDWNKDLWLGLHTQLIKRYSIEKNSHGYGIYVVLWFGEHNRGKMPVTPDGADKPENPKEIQHYLYDRMNPEEKSRIAIRVIDVSWMDNQ